jgi:hypothetical protein
MDFYYHFLGYLALAILTFNLAFFLWRLYTKPGRHRV